MCAAWILGYRLVYSVADRSTIRKVVRKPIHRTTRGLTEQARGVPTVQVLRVVSTQNQIYSGQEARSTHTSCFVRWPVRIGSADVASLRLSFNAWILGTGSAGPSNTANGFTVVKAALEKDGTALHAPITFGGLRTLTVSPGDNDIQSDDLLPAALSQSVFARAVLYWLRIEYSVSGQLPFANGRHTASKSGSQAGWCTQPATTITNGVDSTGIFTVTGTALDARSNGACPIILGKFVSGDPLTVMGIGDSKFQGQGDSTSTAEGFGAFNRATQGDLTNGIASINFNRIGAASGGYNNTTVMTYAKYANCLVDQTGTNDYAATGTGTTLAAIQINLAGIYAKARVNGVETVLRTSLGPRTTGAWTLADQSDQSYSGSGWQASGLVDVFEQWASTAPGVPYHNGYTQVTAWRGSPDPWKWPATGVAAYATTDGTHPTAVMHGLVGAGLRTALLAL